MTANRTPAQLYALLVGGVLVVAGIIGFLYNSSFDTGDQVPRDAVFGILDVNAWHNLVHLATGALGLATFGRAATARTYALALGAVYLVVAIWGFALGDNEVILNIVPVNTEDNVLHLLIAVAGLGAGAASPSGT
ncbi:MAG TPA: DUF4383 domain-containing protein, partial [Solirubrobacteraceae bacterium]|nr:DUF4383 domain-containing protein [Solirubrobacteraceae bacterium]